MFKHLAIASVAALALTACGPASESSTEMNDAPQRAEMSAAQKAQKLDAVLAAQPEKNKARYQYRNPKETLLFLGIEPGMKVAEALPGGAGYYSQILLPYLGADGHLTGLDYSIDMWPLFGGFATPEFIEGKKTWAEEWVKTAADWNTQGAGLTATTFGKVGDDMAGEYDAVLFIRALHNVSRFEAEGGFLTSALADAHKMLKPGGILGVVQHQGPETNSDEWATGSNGYLKKSTVIAQIEAAGFELVAQSDINENPLDMPTEEDAVWRMMPSMATSRDNPELRAKMLTMGESNRMTLRFKKR